MNLFDAARGKGSKPTQSISMATLSQFCPGSKIDLTVRSLMMKIIEIVVYNIR
jgi:hypothetical protein